MPVKAYFPLPSSPDRAPLTRRLLYLGGLTLPPLHTLVLTAAAATATTLVPPVAYQADVVVVSKGTTTRSLVWSDGVRVKTETRGADGETSGNYTDGEKKLSWTWGPGFGCLQMPLEHPGVTQQEDPAGAESIDGHPTRKFKITSTLTSAGKSTTFVEYVWRATDLHDLVVQRKNPDGSFQFNVRNIVLGKPEEKLLAFPAPPCKYDEALDTTHNAPQAAGGFRTVRFFDASCKRLVPLPLTLEIPSDYEIRQGGHLGCFWGTSEDLDRALKAADQADFTPIRRGVYWCRVSDSTEYDPMRRRFVSSQGTDDLWAKALVRESGAKNVVVTPKTVNSIPTLRVTATVGGQKVYMLYIGVGDSPAILINYHPPGKGEASDDGAWQHFLDSLQTAK